MDKQEMNQVEAIKALVDAEGWIAVKQHPLLGPAWRSMMAEQMEFENAIDS